LYAPITRADVALMIEAANYMKIWDIKWE
jgi:hypothetical protein